MDEQQKKQLAKELVRQADFAPPALDMDLLERRMEQAALRGKASRPSQIFFARMRALFALRSVRCAVPAVCCALLVFGVLSMNQPDLPFQPYNSASLPPTAEITRGEAFVWSGLGWAEEAVLEGYKLQESRVGSAATAQSTHQALQFTCVYLKGETTAEVTVSEAALPLWILLSNGKSMEIDGTPVFFGKDDGSCAAVWQRDGLTCSVTTNGNADELIRVVKTVLRWK